LNGSFVVRLRTRSGRVSDAHERLLRLVGCGTTTAAVCHAKLRYCCRSLFWITGTTTAFCRLLPDAVTPVPAPRRFGDYRTMPAVRFAHGVLLLFPDIPHWIGGYALYISTYIILTFTTVCNIPSYRQHLTVRFVRRCLCVPRLALPFISSSTYTRCARL